MKRIKLTLALILATTLAFISIAHSLEHYKYYYFRPGVEYNSYTPLNSTATSSCPTWNPRTLVSEDFQAHEVATKGGVIVSGPAITQLIRDSHHPANWKGNFVGIRATGNTRGSLNEAEVVLPGYWGSGAIPWESSTTEQPTGRLYFNLYYKSVGSIYVRMQDLTANQSTYLGGVPGGLVYYNQGQSANVEIINQYTVYGTDVRLVQGSVLFNNLNNDLRISIIGKPGSSTHTINLYGMDMSSNPAIWKTHIPNKSVLGPEINTSNNFGLTNVTMNGSTLTFNASAGDAIAQLPVSDEFIQGEQYMIRMNIQSQDFAHMLRLGTSDNSFVSTVQAIQSYKTGWKNQLVTCDNDGGRLRILVPNAYYPGTLVASDISVRKFKPNKRVVDSRSGTAMSMYGEPDGVERIIDWDMEGSAAVWYSYGSPAVNVRSSEQAFSGNYSRKFQNNETSGSAGMRSSMFTTTTGELTTVKFQVYPVDDVRTLAVVVRSGDDTKWMLAKAINQYDLKVGQWNEIAYTYTEDSGGSGAYAMIYDTGINRNRYYVDNLSNKTISETTISDSVPTILNYDGDGRVYGRWIPDRDSSDITTYGVILKAGDMEFGYTPSGFYFDDGVDVLNMNRTYSGGNTVYFYLFWGTNTDYPGIPKKQMVLESDASPMVNLNTTIDLGNAVEFMEGTEGGRLDCLKIDDISQDDWM